jgi:hypothetical protein
MGGHDKRGRWRVARRTTVRNIMGGSDIDLNDAELSGTVTELNIYSIMGGCEVRVPHGVDVQMSNFALMGGNDVKLGDEAAAPGAPTIYIRPVSIMGGSDVARGRKPTKEERRRTQAPQSAPTRSRLVRDAGPPVAFFGAEPAVIDLEEAVATLGYFRNIARAVTPYVFLLSAPQHRKRRSDLGLGTGARPST